MYKMSVEELMKKYHPVYPQDELWESTVALNLADDAEIMERLISIAKIVGEFREPITLSSEDDDYAVIDGTHRVCAAHLAGLDEVWVRDYSPDEVLWAGETDVCMVTTIHLADYNSEIADTLFGVIRSIPLSEEKWVTASCASSVNGESTIIWDDVYHSVSDRRILNDAVIERLESRGLKVDFVTTELEYE